MALATLPCWPGARFGQVTEIWLWRDAAGAGASPGPALKGVCLGHGSCGWLPLLGGDMPCCPLPHLGHVLGLLVLETAYICRLITAD